MAAAVAEVDFNPRSPRGGATQTPRRLLAAAQISIHAPHEGERLIAVSLRPASAGFQSTLPTRGSDRLTSPMMRGENVFQSTLPTRGSDSHQRLYVLCGRYISIHAPHEGERLRLTLHSIHGNMISIHAPHEGERLLFSLRKVNFKLFQSTLPTRGSDLASFILSPESPISIHAPHEGERLIILPRKYVMRMISIHAPHEGERQRKSAFVCSISANLLNIIHCGAVTRAVSRRRIALFRLFSVRRSGVFMYAYASH